MDNAISNPQVRIPSEYERNYQRAKTLLVWSGFEDITDAKSPRCTFSKSSRCVRRGRFIGPPLEVQATLHVSNVTCPVWKAPRGRCCIDKSRGACCFFPRRPAAGCNCERHEGKRYSTMCSRPGSHFPLAQGSSSQV